MAGENRHVVTRMAHRREVAEDYLEAILDQIEVDGDARLMELARHFGVSHPTVAKIVKRLASEGLVTVERYRCINLTEPGKRIALEARERHRTIVAFLNALGLDQAQAEIDAEGIEHHASSQLLRQMELFIARSRPNLT